MSALPMPVPESSRLLVGLEQAKALLAEARTVDEVKQLRDQAEAMRVYVRQQQLGRDAEVYAAEIRVRAERRIGELTAALPTQAGGRPSENDTDERYGFASKAQVLRQAGVQQQRASEYERLASMPDDLFEVKLRQATTAGAPITTTGLLRLTASPTSRTARPDETPEWTAPPEEPPHGAAGLPGKCPACDADVLIQVWCGVINGKPFHKLFWVPPEKIGQDWYPDDDEAQA